MNTDSIYCFRRWMTAVLFFLAMSMVGCRSWMGRRPEENGAADCGNISQTEGSRSCDVTGNTTPYTQLAKVRQPLPGGIAWSKPESISPSSPIRQAASGGDGPDDNRGSPELENCKDAANPYVPVANLRQPLGGGAISDNAPSNTAIRPAIHVGGDPAQSISPNASLIQTQAQGPESIPLPPAPRQFMMPASSYVPSTLPSRLGFVPVTSPTIPSSAPSGQSNAAFPQKSGAASSTRGTEIVPLQATTSNDSEQNPIQQVQAQKQVQNASAKLPAESSAADQYVGPVSSPPALPPPNQEMPIDLLTAWRLAGASNPTIAIAQQVINEALALQMGARLLLVPNLNAGGNYHLHNGPLQRSAGQILKLDEQSLYFGGGAGAVSTSTPAVPMVQLLVPLVDAYYEPLAARQLVHARQLDQKATQNAVLLDVTNRYLNLVLAESRLTILRATEKDVNEIARLTAAYARTGRGPPADAHRAHSEALLFHSEVQRAEGDVAEAAAQLAQLLTLDPSVHLRLPPEAVQVVSPITLIPSEEKLEQLLQVALNMRPEMGAHTAMIEENQIHLQQEKMRPFVPTLFVGYSAAAFGGGSNLQPQIFGNVGPRTDFDAYLLWTFQNFGLGNLALVRQRRATLAESQSERIKMVNLIRRQVTDAYAEIRAQSRNIEVCRRKLETGENGFREDLRRIFGGVGLPIEVLDSFRLLAEARVSLLRAIIEYNRSQFELFVALGRSPTQVEGNNGQIQQAP